MPIIKIKEQTMRDNQSEDSFEKKRQSNSTNVDKVAIDNAKWDGVITSDLGDSVIKIRVTMNSITSLFRRGNGLLVN
jgi:hypothetical protein